MKKRFIIVLLLVGICNWAAAQDVFYRSYVPYTAQSYFSFFSNLKKRILSSNDVPQNSINIVNHFINWSELDYFCTLYKRSQVMDGDNFVVDPWVVTQEEGKQVRAMIYQDLLSIVIDSDLTLKRLIFLNLDFRSLLFDRLYDPQFINSVSTTYSKLMLYSLFKFTGKNGLIDLFVQSKYYAKEIPLQTAEGPYIPNPYQSLVVEARGLGLQPSLFPNIYSYDKDGNLILVYSYKSADKSKIVSNGYAHFIKTEKNLVEDSKNFYVAAFAVNGEAKTDIVISRENYLKYFSSEQAIKNLKEGNFYIVIGS